MIKYTSKIESEKHYLVKVSFDDSSSINSASATLLTSKNSISAETELVGENVIKVYKPTLEEAEDYSLEKILVTTSTGVESIAFSERLIEEGRETATTPPEAGGTNSSASHQVVIEKIFPEDLSFQEILSPEPITIEQLQERVNSLTPEIFVGVLAAEVEGSLKATTPEAFVIQIMSFSKFYTLNDGELANVEKKIFNDLFTTTPLYSSLPTLKIPYTKEVPISRYNTSVVIERTLETNLSEIKDNPYDFTDILTKRNDFYDLTGAIDESNIQN